MDRNQLNVALCAILETLDESGPAVEAILQVSLMHCGIQEPGTVIDLAVTAGLAERRSGHEIAITAAGRDIAAKSRAVQEAQKLADEHEEACAEEDGDEARGRED